MQLTLFPEDNQWMHSLCFTGHRPDKLGGYNPNNPIMLDLKQKLTALIEQLIVEKGISHFYTGGALGVDQLAFWCVHALKAKYPHIQNIVAIPFKNQSIKWSPAQQKSYEEMLSLADEVIDVSHIPAYDSKEAPDLPIESFSSKKMHKRNEYMVDQARFVIAVYDGTNGGTSNCYRYAKKNERTVYVMNPKKEFELRIEAGVGVD